MPKKLKCIICFLLVLLTLTGCMRTVDKMYRLPKRSEEFQDLQKAMDKAMTGMEYCAPLAGENQQAVQMADLNGDGTMEYLLFAKADSEHPLRIMIFQKYNDSIQLAQTIESNGSAFDQVEYIQMDEEAGMELVFGSKLTDQVLRSVSVYTFHMDLEGELLVTTNYSKFLTVDIDMDSRSELFVIHPGQSETDRGVAEVYGVENDILERSNEVSMSQPAANLKRVLVGNLHGGKQAVYVASTVDEKALITDVYTSDDGVLANVSLNNESGTSVKTLRNYYIYADDIDNDGTVELPALIPMKTVEEKATPDRHQLIRWYAMTESGEEVDKRYTYHNLVGGWYVELNKSWASRLMVLSQGSNYEFYIWDEDFETYQRLLTIFVFTDQERASQASKEGRFLLYSTDTVTYAVALESIARNYGITLNDITEAFKLIQQDWKTGET